MVPVLRAGILPVPPEDYVQDPDNSLPYWCTPHNTEFLAYIGQLTRSKAINDESYQLLSHFAKQFHIVTLPEPDNNIYCYPKNESEIASAKFGFSFAAPSATPSSEATPGTPQSPEQLNIAGSLKDFHLLTDEDKQYQNCLLTIKEVTDGYVDLRLHSVIVTDEKWASQAVTYKMAEDITMVIDHENQKVISLAQQQTKYSAKKTANAWIIVDDTTWVETNYKDFETFTITKLPNWHTQYHLRGAYTHILRKILNFQPQQWQMQYLLWEKNENYLAGCRRMGKTALAAYCIPRELFAMPSKSMFRNRPRKALFIAPTKDKYKEVLDYFMEYTSKIRELRNIIYNSKLDRIVFEDQIIWIGRSRVATPLSICDFGTSRWFEAWRGKAADWIGVEEAGYVPEQVFDNIMPIVEGEGAKFFCISTINAEDTAQWFLRELTRAEERMRHEDPNISKNIFALRVTIDDIDERVMTSSQKENTKARAMLRGWAYYFAELFATVPSQNSVFDTNGFFIPLLTTPPTGWTVIIAYDPAKRADYWAVTISGMMDNKLVLFETVRWQGLDYHEQRDRFAKLLTRFSGSKVITVMDATGVGEAVREIFKGLIQYHIWYSNRKQPASVDNFWTWNVGKRDLVEITQSLIESRQLVATMDQDVLSQEMVSFTEYRTKQGSFTYSAKTWHDDVVNAMLMTGFIYGKILGHFRDMTTSQMNTSKWGTPWYGYKPKPSMSGNTFKGYGFK